MKLSDLLRQELAKRGLTSYTKSARFLGVSVEFVRMTLQKQHVPKDKKLITIAERLGIDATPLAFDGARLTARGRGRAIIEAVHAAGADVDAPVFEREPDVRQVDREPRGAVDREGQRLWRRSVGAQPDLQGRTLHRQHLHGRQPGAALG